MELISDDDCLMCYLVQERTTALELEPDGPEHGSVSVSGFDQQVVDLIVFTFYKK